LIAPRLREDGASAEHATAGAPSFRGALGLDDLYAATQFRNAFWLLANSLWKCSMNSG
jgi:hypothetical protein